MDLRDEAWAALRALAKIVTEGLRGEAPNQTTKHNPTDMPRGADMGTQGVMGTGGKRGSGQNGDTCGRTPSLSPSPSPSAAGSSGRMRSDGETGCCLYSSSSSDSDSSPPCVVVLAVGEWMV